MSKKEDKKEVKMKGVMDRIQITAYLESLVLGLKSGVICVHQGKDIVTLNPEGPVEVEVKASSKKGKEKFEMELTWRKVDVDKDSPEMTISPVLSQEDARSEEEGEQDEREESASVEALPAVIELGEESGSTDPDDDDDDGGAEEADDEQDEDENDEDEQDETGEYKRTVY